MGSIRATWQLYIGCFSKAKSGRHPTKAHYPSPLKPKPLGIGFAFLFSTASSTVPCQIFGEFKGKFDNIDGWLAEEALSSVIHQSVNRVLSDPFPILVA